MSLPESLNIDGKFPIVDFVKGAMVGYCTKINNAWNTLSSPAIHEINEEELLNFSQATNSYCLIKDQPKFMSLVEDTLPVIETKIFSLDFAKQE